ncbi:MAG: dihydrofolate reductase, partial [Bacteroidetes bacterium]|nr:dihydrofolate reductase [Bacteroidota bacterium]
IVITRNENFSAEGIVVKKSVEDGISYAKQNGEEELFIIGGAEIFKIAMPLADKILLTRVHNTFPADVYFKDFDVTEWELTHQEFHAKDEKHEEDFTFLEYRRI